MKIKDVINPALIRKENAKEKDIAEKITVTGDTQIYTTYAEMPEPKLTDQDVERAEQAVMNRLYPYYWRLKKHLPERKGQRCRIVERDGKSVKVDFEDGFQVWANILAVRKVK